MSIQSIINISEKMSINRRKVIGVQYTRSEIARVSETPTRNPWRFKLTASAGLRYYNSRAILEQLDFLDRKTPEIISFGSNPNLSWMFRYQGRLSDFEISQIQVGSFVGTTLNLIIPFQYQTPTVFFEAGDLIQLQSHPYPFTVIERYTGADINNTVLQLTTHRPNFITTNIQGSPIVVGSNCQFNLFCSNMPTYSLVPGAVQYSQTGELINNAHIEFDDDFQLYEFTAAA